MRLNSGLDRFTSGDHLQYPPNRRLSCSGGRDGEGEAEEGGEGEEGGRGIGVNIS